MTDIPAPHPDKLRLTIRVGSRSLSFSSVTPGGTAHPVTFKPYTVKNGISMAANLREAFKTADLLAYTFQHVLVMVDSPVLMIPLDLFESENLEELYCHSFPKYEGHLIAHTLLPELNAVAVYSINKDFKLVVTDHYPEAEFCCALAPVWRYLHQRSFMSRRRKLYGYFHECSLDVFSFTQNRFRFCNSFDLSQTPLGSANAHDALYYLLCVWKQLALKPEFDELHLVGDIPDKDWLTGELRQYLQRAYVIIPASDFNRAPVTRIHDMPFDLVTMFVRGRV